MNNNEDERVEAVLSTLLAHYIAVGQRGDDEFRGEYHFDRVVF